MRDISNSMDSVVLRMENLFKVERVSMDNRICMDSRVFREPKILMVSVVLSYYK